MAAWKPTWAPGLGWRSITGTPITRTRTLIVRGRDDTGKDLIIAGDYIADGFRHRAAELATEWLGPRTELEIQQTLGHEVEQERWTSLDRTREGEAGDDGRVRVERFNAPLATPTPIANRPPATACSAWAWLTKCSPAPGPSMPTRERQRALGERGDIIRTMQRAMRGEPRELAVFEPGQMTMPVAAASSAAWLRRAGRRAARPGLSGHRRRGPSKAHYVALNARDELANYPTGAVVEVGVRPTCVRPDKALLRWRAMACTAPDITAH